MVSLLDVSMKDVSTTPGRSFLILSTGLSCAGMMRTMADLARVKRRSLFKETCAVSA